MNYKLSALGGKLFVIIIFLCSGFTISAAPIIFNVPTGTTVDYTLQLTGPNNVLVNNLGPGFDGTLVLTGNGPGVGVGIGNNYTGDTSVQGGIMQAGAGSGVGNAFSPNSDFNLAGGSTLDLNGNNETIASLSSADRTTIVTDSANGSAVLRINDANSSLGAPYTFAGTLTDGGAGNTLALVKQGPGTLVLLGANNFGGGTTLTAGTLEIGAAPGSHISTALGTGNVTNASILETTAAAGGATEKIMVAGNYTQTGGGEFLLQVVSSPAPTPSIGTGIAGTNYDTLSVAGNATLAGTLHLHFGGASVPSQGQRYVALTAGAPLTSEFAFPTTTNLPTPFFTVTTYNDTFGGTAPNNSAIVTLLRPFATFPGLTPNQTSVAENIDANLTFLNNSGALAMPAGLYADFFNNLVTGLNVSTYTNGLLGASLDQLSPQRFEILRNIAFDNYAMDIQSLDDEFARERDGIVGLDTSGFVLNDHRLGDQLSEVKSRLLAWTPAPEAHGLLSDSAQAVLGGVDMTDKKEMKEITPEAILNKWNGFIDGGVDLGDLEHNEDVSHSSYTTGRVRGGFDYLISNNFRVGAFFGYGHTDADLDNEGSKAHIDSYTPGIFVNYADQQGYYANGIFTYTRNDYSTDRNIAIPGFNRTATGAPSGDQFGGDLDGGYDFHEGPWTMGPSAGLTYVNLGIAGFTESGAGVANLSIRSQSSESLRSRLGGTIRYNGRIGSVLLTPHLSAFWQHEFLDGVDNITSQFEGLPVGSFSTQTVAGDSDNALIGVGLDAQVSKAMTIFIDYQAEAGGSSFFGEAASGGVRIAF